MDTAIVLPQINARRSPSRWRLFGAFMLLAFVATLAITPYLAEFMSIGGTFAQFTPDQVAIILAISALLDRMLPTSVAVGLGLWLAGKVGLDAPLIRAWAIGQRPAGLNLRRILVPALIGGLVVSVVPYLSSSLTPLLLSELDANQAAAAAAAANITPWKGALAAFSAGVLEEIQYRFGLMTLFVWLVCKLTRRAQPGMIIMLAGILFAVIPFGLMHLSNLWAMGISITFGAALLVVLLNSAGGILFGWLYWRRGLESAMVAHFTMDIVIKAIVPLLVSLSLIGG